MATARREQPFLRRAELCVIGITGVIEFLIQRPLTNFNSRNRNAHWSKKNQERKAWQASLTNALVFAVGMPRAQELLVPSSGLFGAKGEPPLEKRRVALKRMVPSKRNFIRDDFDNLRWCTKELRDALKQCGLIRDDSSKWCEMSIEQDVSFDQTYWTWIAIEPMGAEARS